jgi:DNA-binding transcriptional LysR family regulator
VTREPARAALDPGLLPTFLAVVDAGRISAAARTLHASQPAVTARIRRLEESLGAQLFRRSVRGVVPTAEGERLIRYAREVQALLDRAGADIGAEADEGEGLLLGASTTVAAHVLPAVLTGFRASHPRAPLRLEVGNTDHVLAEVVAGRVPLGIVEGHARAAGLRLEPFVTDEIVPVAGPKMRGRVRSAGDLRDLPLLWREPGSGTRAVIERALRTAGIRRKVQPLDVELGSNEAILGCAAEGLGVAFASRWTLGPYLSTGRLVILSAAAELTVRRAFRWALPAGALHGIGARFYAYAQRHPPAAP